MLEVSLESGWASAAPLYSFRSSHLQQKVPDLTVPHLIEEITYLSYLKIFGRSICYPRPFDSNIYAMFVLVLSDASRNCENGQLGIIAGLLKGPLQAYSLFHNTARTSHNCSLPLKSVCAAAIIAYGEEIDEEIHGTRIYKKLKNCCETTSLFGF